MKHGKASTSLNENKLATIQHFNRFLHMHGGKIFWSKLHAGPEVISVKSGLWPPSLLPIFGPKATQKTVFMIRNQSN